MKGRPPKPREQRIAEGNPGNRPLPEPVLGLGKVLDFPAPSTLSPAERNVWDELVPEVAALGWIDRVDRAMLELLVQQLALVEQARESVRRDGFMLTDYDKDGNERGLKVNPAARLQVQATAQALRLAEQFGLTSSARARLGLTVAKGATLAQQLANDLDDDADEVVVVEDATDG
jgi:P27 family predicted phage terminase small subunit